jgi:hypothetical protein
MIRGRGIMGIFPQKVAFFKGFGSLRGQSPNLDSSEGYSKNG